METNFKVKHNILTYIVSFFICAISSTLVLSVNYFFDAESHLGVRITCFILSSILYILIIAFVGKTYFYNHYYKIINEKGIVLSVKSFKSLAFIASGTFFHPHYEVEYSLEEISKQRLVYNAKVCFSKIKDTYYDLSQISKEVSKHIEEKVLLYTMCNVTQVNIKFESFDVVNCRKPQKVVYLEQYKKKVKE